jgi:hypothetical protein
LEIQLFTEHTKEFLEWMNQEIQEKKYLDQNHKPHYRNTIIDFPDIEKIIGDIFILAETQAIFMLILAQRTMQDPRFQEHIELVANIKTLMTTQSDFHSNFFKIVKLLEEVNDGYDKL